MTRKTGAQRQAEYRARKAQEGLKDVTMRLDQTTRDSLATLSAHYNTDLASTVARVTAQAVERLADPTCQQRDPSPLHWGADTASLCNRLLAESEGDHRQAGRLLVADIRRRYSGFRASDRTSAGFLEYDRARHYLDALKNRKRD